MSAANEKLDKSKKKLAAELEDATLELDTHRSKVLELEKKQRNFDKILSEEKMNADRIAGERDAAEREARDKETRLLNMNRELEDVMSQLEDSERAKRQLQGELDDLVNSQVLLPNPSHFSLDFWLEGPHEGIVPSVQWDSLSR